MATLARVAKFGAPRVPEVVGSVYISKRHKATDLTTTNYKRGTGGRSSFSGTVATVFGAKSTLGRLVVNRLGKVGSQVIIPYRGDSYYMRDFKLMGDLGQILFNPIDLNDEESLRNSMQYSNVVINLIGQEFETSNFSFSDVNVEGPRKLARLAKECGVEKFVHVSALNAGRVTSNMSAGGSQFLKTKLEGEEAVREQFPEATIMRPSNFVDLNDKFLFYFTTKPRFHFDIYPGSRYIVRRTVSLWHLGEDTIRMPVRTRNVAQGIMAALSEPEAPGKTYQCVGPCAYKLVDLVDFMFRCRNQTIFLDDKIWKVKLRAYIREMIYKRIHFPLPKITLDTLEKETISDELDPSLPTLEDLGVTPENVEDIIAFIFRPYFDAGLFKETIGRVPMPERPPALFPTLQQ